MNTFISLVVLLIFNYSANADSDCEHEMKQNMKRHNNQHHKNKLYILKSEDVEQLTMSEKFIELAANLGYKTETLQIPHSCSDELIATEIVARKFKNVINLKAKVPTTFDEPSNLTIVGYIGEYIENNESNTLSVCNISAVKNPPTYNGHDINTPGYNETCDVINAPVAKVYTYVYLKLASKTIEEKYSLLYQVLNDFSLDYRKENYSYWNRNVGHNRFGSFEQYGILVCMDKLIYHPQYNNNLFGESVGVAKTCRAVENFAEHNFLSALVPEPFKEEDITYLPVIFYNIPFLLPEHEEAYPNGMVLYNNHLNLLAEAVMKLVELKKWPRVAIMSDDLPYSEQFESKLVDLLRIKGIIYREQQCSVTARRECDFQEALKSIKDSKATIIIANVEDKHANHLVNTATQYGLTSSTTAWIFRDWPFKKHIEVTKALGDVYSMYLAPSEFDGRRDQHFLDNIDNAIAIIKDIRKAQSPDIFRETYLNRCRTIYRKMADAINGRKTTWAHLRKISYNGQRDTVFSAEIDNQSNEIKVLQHPDSIGYRDMSEDCLVLGSKFDAPCEDSIVLIIICIVCVVLLVGLITLIVVQKYAVRRPNNYRSFN